MIMATVVKQEFPNLYTQGKKSLEDTTIIKVGLKTENFLSELKQEKRKI